MRTLLLAFVLLFGLSATAEAKHPHRHTPSYRHNCPRPDYLRYERRYDYYRSNRRPIVIYDSFSGTFRVYYQF